MRLQLFEFVGEGQNTSLTIARLLSVSVPFGHDALDIRTLLEQRLVELSLGLAQLAGRCTQIVHLDGEVFHLNWLFVDKLQPTFPHLLLELLLRLLSAVSSGLRILELLVEVLQILVGPLADVVHLLSNRLIGLPAGVADLLAKSSDVALQLLLMQQLLLLLFGGVGQVVLELANAVVVGELLCIFFLNITMT